MTKVIVFNNETAIDLQMIIINKIRIISHLKTIGLLMLLLAALLYACSNNSVAPVNPPPSGYKKVFITGSGDTRFEIYSATKDSLVTGYNDIGFKVFQNGQELKSGYVKFNPIMHHPPPIPSFHSAPVSPQFNYDNNKQMYMGYICFTMYSDSTFWWYGFFNYNETLHIDSVFFRVLINQASQMRTFVDNTLEASFYITLAAPLYPKQGLNDFKCLVHMTHNDVTYTEIDSAQIYMFPWMNLMGHSSSSNVSPVYVGGGIYSGQVNFNMSGEWFVYDTIHYQNRVISPVNSPPKFIIEVP